MQRLLQIMEDKEIKFVLVVDEYGGTAGIVTSSDITDQIVGSIDDEYVQNEDSDVVPLSFDSFLIDASIPVSEVTELIGFVPENAGECETAAGLLLNIFDRIPKTGDKISVEYKNTKATFTVLAMEKHRIEKISVKIEKHQVDDKAYETLS